jgi:hypothetical protein
MCFNPNAFKKMGNRIKIPAEVRREVRKRCGFGCIICGQAFYEYDHLIDWSIVEEHDPNNLTLLCDNHHKAKTNGRMPLTFVQDKNREPYNTLCTSPRSEYLTLVGDKFSVSTGGLETSGNLSQESDRFFPLVIDGVPIVTIRFEDGRILFSINLYNKDNELVLQVVDNEIITYTSAWDVEIIGNQVTVRAKLHDVCLGIKPDVTQNKISIMGNIFLNGVHVRISRDKHIKFNAGGIIKNCQANIVMVGLYLGDLAGEMDRVPGAAIKLEVKQRNPYKNVILRDTVPNLP